MIVKWLNSPLERRPDIPEGVSFRVIRDLEDGTCEVEILSGDWPLRTNKGDVWRRATDQEAEAIAGMLDAQPARLRKLWDDSAYLSHNDELFSVAHAAAVQAFGKDRADELLAPSGPLPVR